MCKEANTNPLLPGWLPWLRSGSVASCSREPGFSDPRVPGPVRAVLVRQAEAGPPPKETLLPGWYVPAGFLFSSKCPVLTPRKPKTQVKDIRVTARSGASAPSAEPPLPRAGRCSCLLPTRLFRLNRGQVLPRAGHREAPSPRAQKGGEGALGRPAPSPPSPRRRGASPEPAADA